MVETVVSHQSGGTVSLHSPFHLAGERAASVQYFEMESRLAMHAPDGSITGTDIYRLSLKCTPAGLAGTAGDVYTCRRFTVQRAGAPQLAIPSLEGWTYEFTAHPFEKSGGPTLGIPHGPFEGLTDQDGQAVPAGNAYHVYNAFIDFHSFFVFTDPTPAKGGIQDLSRIGQRIVHSAAFSQPSTSLGSQVNEGSYFRNGEVTLELKGLGVVDGSPCAIVGYDSGASSFVMLVTAAPTLEVRTAGSSHYWGDIYKDLDTNWVRRAFLTELVVSETTVPGQSATVKGAIERSILVRNVPSDQP
jgi:hypothetical protein